MPSHVGSYDRKRDPDNFLHLFKGAIRMQKCLMPVACHMFTYTLKDSARIWWNSQKAGSILNYEDLKVKFRSYFSQQKRITKTHLAVHSNKQREGESVRAFATRQWQVLLVVFSGEKSWAIGEILLEITIGDAPLSRSETPNFIIIRCNSPYNMLLRRTAMQKIGMVVSTIHGVVKFHTTQGIRTVFSTHESDKIGQGVKKIRETSPSNTEGVLSCT
ncbi:reverse transcriptase domain-containing protein [Tanacetum coccineum]